MSTVASSRKLYIIGWKQSVKNKTGNPHQNLLFDFIGSYKINIKIVLFSCVSNVGILRSFGFYYVVESKEKKLEK
jgi:hypothetical protein